MAAGAERVDAAHMVRALELARRGGGWVNPNPQVGCVIVRDGRTIGEGWHARFGGLHAERAALADCRARAADPRGAVAYVTLEPCCHTGKTPPCTEALIEAGVARVVVGAADPNPLVAGKGCAALRAAGIQVTEGVLARACEDANEPFFHFIRTGRPLVIAKYAMTLDGKAATRTGAARWVTGSLARRKVHEDRARFAAVMVGVGTVIADDPMLTCRLEDVQNAAAVVDAAAAPCAETTPAPADGSSGPPPARRAAGQRPAAPHQPLRIVCDTRLRTPPASRLVRTADAYPTLIATANGDERAHRPYLESGCDVVVVPAAANGRVDMAALLAVLGERGVDSVVVEGGPTLLGAAFDAGLADKVQAYIAPKVFGGGQAPSPVGGRGVATPAEAFALADVRVIPLGDDLLVEGWCEKPCSRE